MQSARCINAKAGRKKAGVGITSCDVMLLRESIPSVDYKDIIISNGISCFMHVVPYAGIEIYYPNGRVFPIITQTLLDIGIGCEEIDLENILDTSFDYKNAYIFVPKWFLDKTDKINSSAVQFETIYSMFKITDVCPPHIHLALAETESFAVDFTVLEKITKLRVKPFGDSIKVIYINNSAVTMSRCQLIQNMRKNLLLSLCQDTIANDMSIDGIRTVAGNAFYDKFNSIIHNFNEMHQVQKRIFINSFLAGSAYFYRKEFVDALDSQELIPSHIYRDLLSSAKNWRQIGRMFNLDDRLDAHLIEKLVEQNRELEMNAIKQLYNCEISFA